jgi:hypothetical protein
MSNNNQQNSKPGLGPVSSVLLAFALMALLGLANMWVFSTFH